MRNVMVRCIFSALLVGLLNVIRAQDQRGFHWSDQQVLADEWQPFIPSFLSSHDRPVHNYARPDTVRQFFGKTVEPLPPQGPAPGAGGALLKKSFQASSANNVDHYSVPPILTSFNSFGVPAVQTRNPLLDKNIKDGGHFLEQSSHLHGKYHQPVHRLPAYVSQYQPSNIQYHHHQLQQQPQQFQNNQFLTRLENQPKQSPVLIQPPSHAVSTSVQVFPSSQQSQYAPNTYFLGVPPKESDEEPPSRKITRPDDFLSSNGAGSIYGRESVAAAAALNVLPPALPHRPGPSPFSPARPEPNHFLFDNVRPSLPDRYETINGFAGRTPAAYHEPHNVKHVTESTKTAQEDVPPPNPSKQVFEQLSHFGRPFSLPKEGNDFGDYSRVKAANEAKNDAESLSSYSVVPPPPFKKEKAKPHRYHAKDEGDVVGYRAPSKNMYLPGSAVPPAKPAVDYEPGKLQSVKTVTYFPQTDVIRFSEQDVSGNVNEYQYPPAHQSGGGSAAFLPTPTESHDDVAGATFSPVDKFTTPQPLETVTKARNHKYSNVRNGVDDDGTRSRYHHRHQQPLHQDESGAYSVEDQRTKYSPAAEYSLETTTTTTTRKTPGRRRKPSKTKNKDYDSVGSNGNGAVAGANYKYRGNSGHSDRTTSIENYEISIASDSNDAPATESASGYKKKHSRPTTIRTTATTAASSEDDYPNYPNYPNYPPQPPKRNNYPTDSRHTNSPAEYESSASAASADGADYFNAEKEDGDNYPSLKIRPKARPTGFGSAGNSDSPTSAETTTASSPKSRVKSKYGGVTATAAAAAANSTRPRFSIKEYRRTSTASPSSSVASPTSEAALDEAAAFEKKKNRKQLFAMRGKNKTETATASAAPTAAGDEPSLTRKYKPRVRPSKYKNASLSLTTTATPTEATTTLRVNTFRPAAAAANRYRSSTSKYYNRYRATTESPAEDAAQGDDNDNYDDSGYGKKSDVIDANDDSAPASSDAKPTRVGPLFSAKRASASLGKPVTSELEDDDDEDADDSGGVRKSVAIAANVASDEPKKEAKKSSSRYKQTATKLAAVDKADDAAQTSIMTSSEERAEKDDRKNGVSDDRPEQTVSLAHDGDEDDTSSFEDEDDAGEERGHGYSGRRDESGDHEVPKPAVLATETAEPTVTTKPEETTEGTSPPATVVAEERKDDDRGADDEGSASSAKYDDDDDGERVSKVSSLTSQSGSPNRVGLYQQWRPPVLTVGRVTTIKKTSD